MVHCNLYVGLRMSSSPYIAIPIDSPEDERFSDVLRPSLTAAFLFGPSRFYGGWRGTVSMIFYVVTLLLMLFTSCVGVFFRKTVDVWVQFCIYIVPVVTLVSGWALLGSNSYKRLLRRPITSRTMVSFLLPTSHTTENRQSDDSDKDLPGSFAQNRNWLKMMATKNCVYPLIIEVVQWCGYVTFHYFDNGTSFSGLLEKSKYIPFDQTVWLPFYFTFWTIGAYFVGYIAFQFVFVSRLIVRDVTSLMSLFGYSPFLRLRPSHKYYLLSKTCIGKIFATVLGFVLLDALESDMDTYVGSKQVWVQRNGIISENKSKIPVRCLENKDMTGSTETLTELADDYDTNITEYEAARIVTYFISEIDELTSYFKPFTITVTFFSVTNLITHLSLFALGNKETIHFWTFFRTVLYLLISIRLLTCVSQISSVIGKIPLHIKYLRAIGKLHEQGREWDNLLTLTSNFELGERSFGFPLSLRQVASLATVLKMSFLIILSLSNTIKLKDII